MSPKVCEACGQVIPEAPTSIPEGPTFKELLDTLRLSAKGGVTGMTRAQLAKWGVGWPAQKGWLGTLRRAAGDPHPGVSWARHPDVLAAREESPGP